MLRSAKYVQLDAIQRTSADGGPGNKGVVSKNTQVMACNKCCCNVDDVSSRHTDKHRLPRTHCETHTGPPEWARQSYIN